MWLTKISWAQQVWALPFLTVLAHSERYYATQKRAAKTLLDWARQMVYQLRRAGCPTEPWCWWWIAPMLLWTFCMRARTL